MRAIIIIILSLCLVVPTLFKEEPLPNFDVTKLHKLQPLVYRYFGRSPQVDLALAQMVLETNWMDNYKCNNMFGIKGVGNAGSRISWTTEYIHGKKVKVKDKFACYTSWNASLAHYMKVMRKDRYKAVREAKTFEEAARAVQKAGYATDPHYADKLIRIYEQYVRQ